MASSLTQLRVFLATPAGLGTERHIFREEVCRFNEDHGYEMGFVLVAVGWEQVPSGAGRPQSLINKEVRGSDYLVALIWDRWGTPTSADSKYSSGTQEELDVALACLRDQRMAMRDVAVFFKAVEVRRLSDPGPQLEQVLQFKQQLEAHGELLFQTFDTTEEWRRQLQRRFMSWIKDFGDKVPREVAPPELPDRSLFQQTHGATISELLARARELEDEGFMTQAESAYAVAVATDDRESLMSFAKFLRRTGRLEKAFETNTRILALEDLLVTRSSSADRADVVANMGVIRRKQGALAESRRLLDEAIRTARVCPDSAGIESEAYALDNLGLTLRRLGMSDAALKSHEEALSRRRQLADESGQAKALLNIARIRRDQDDLEAARALVTEAIAMLEGEDGEQRTLANAYSSLGDIVRAAGDLDTARELYEKSLVLNEEYSHADGTAVACGQLAQLLLALDRTDDALSYAERCLDENMRSGNQEGVAISLRILGEVKHAAKDFGKAKAYFEDSFEMFKKHRNVSGSVSAKIGVAEALMGDDQVELSRMAADEAYSVAQSAAISVKNLDRISKLRGTADS